MDSENTFWAEVTPLPEERDLFVVAPRKSQSNETEINF